jgi:ribosomal-protein-alanine N-acetyltransferase
VIRPLTADDADELARLLVENRAFLAPFEPDRNERFYTVEGQRERLERDDKHAFAIFDGDRIAGAVALSNVVRPAREREPRLLGRRAAQRPWGRDGGRRRAAPDCVRELGLHRLEAGTLVDNVASQRLLEKNGFEQVGIARGYLHIGGEWRDHVLFQLLAG